MIETRNLSRTHLLRTWLFALAALATLALATSSALAGKVTTIGTPIEPSQCERCRVQMTFANKMRDLGAELEFVELRNGIGVFYTTADIRMVPKIQAANEWARGELMRMSTSSAASLALCQYCTASRPIYSRIDREVVRTEHGALFIMRSEDREAVKALLEMRRRAIEGRVADKQAPAPSR